MTWDKTHLIRRNHEEIKKRYLVFQTMEFPDTEYLLSVKGVMLF